MHFASKFEQINRLHGISSECPRKADGHHAETQLTLELLTSSVPHAPKLDSLSGMLASMVFLY